jgi:hypothetical protein
VSELIAPDAVENSPAAQRTHDAELAAALVVEYVPAKHALHMAA